MKINYKGSETLKEQKVGIIVKARSSNLSAEAVKNVTDNTIHFEDIFNENTEYYIQIPATLNEYGDLSSLTLGPFPEGSYWVLVTLAVNEISLEPEEKIFR